VWEAQDANKEMPQIQTYTFSINSSLIRHLRDRGEQIRKRYLRISSKECFQLSMFNNINISINDIYVKNNVRCKNNDEC
jgi:hypothetical protein